MFERFQLEKLRTEILKLRNGIRTHRDQIGDDRCWLDDSLLYGLLSDTPPGPVELPSWEVMEEKCLRFFNNRQCGDCPHPTPSDAVQNRSEWDRDLARMDKVALNRELLHLKRGICAHRDISEERRKFFDDECLYALLPEKLPANTRLTGEAFMPSCRRFWQTRQGQNPQKLHEW